MDLILTTKKSRKNSRISPLLAFQLRLKRLLDIIGILCLLPVIIPVILAAVIAIRATSKGPIIFKQIRSGKDGQPFELYKLRTMRINNDDRQHREYVAKLIKGEAERNDGTFKLTNDPRVTSVGRFLRHYSIDEIPQLFNVLRGDMSLVGPRPALPHEVELYDPHARKRLVAKPGLTGLWQVSGRCDLTFEEMVDLDIAYWQNWNVLRDIKIILQTPAVVLGGKGAA